MRLDREVKFTTEISPVCLPSVSLGLEGRQGRLLKEVVRELKGLLARAGSHHPSRGETDWSGLQ